MAARVPRELKVFPFSAPELAFFQVPRTWPEICRRFGKSRSLHSVVDADCDGGKGLLLWCKRTKTWRLTDSGRSWVRWIAAA